MEKIYNFSASGELLKIARMPFLLALIFLMLGFTEMANSQVVTGTSVCFGPGNSLTVGVTPTARSSYSFGLYRTPDGNPPYTLVDQVYNPAMNFTFVSQTVVGTYEVWQFDSAIWPPPADPTSGTYLGEKYVWALPVPAISGSTLVCPNSSGNIYTTEASMTNYIWNVTGATSTTGGGTGDNSITVTWGATGTGHVKVSYTNGNSCTAAAQTDYPVTIDYPVYINTTGYPTLQAAIDAATTGQTIELICNHSEGLVTINKTLTIDGNGNTLTSTSPTWGLGLEAAGINVHDLTLTGTVAQGIQQGCDANNLVMTNVTVYGCGGTGISVYGSDNCTLTNITSHDNVGNGLNITNCNNTTINGITTYNNAFGGGFSAGIGLFTSQTHCLPAVINGVTLSGTISIAEPTKVYSEKAAPADVITGLSGTQLQWAVGYTGIFRYYWPDKATCYSVADAMFEAPYNLSNTLIYVVEIANEDYYVNDDPNGDNTPPMLISAAITYQAAGETIYVDPGTYSGNIHVTKSLNIIGDPGDANPGPGVNAAIIDGGGSPGDAFLIDNGVTNVVIKGFEMGNFASNDTGIGNGISAWEASTSNITIQDNYFHDLGWNGIMVGNDGALGDHTNWLIKNNILEKFAAYGFELTNASNSSIEYNLIHSDLTSDPYTCIMVDARRNESGITIKYNTIDGQFNGGGFPVIFIFANGAETPNANLNNVVIENNLISATTTAKIIWIYNYPGGTVTGVSASNNSLSTLKNSTPVLVTATCNWWGTIIGNTIAGQVTGNVDYDPWLITSTNNATGPGFFQTTPDCSGSTVAITSLVPANAICGVNGSLTVNYSGGSGPHTISWTGTGSGSAVDNDGSPYLISLPGGSYTVTVTDNNLSYATSGPVTVPYLPVKNTTGPVYFATISAAVAAAAPGNTIEICNGVYPERVVIDKSLTLRGQSEAGTILDGSTFVDNGNGITLNNGVTGVTIEYLTIQNYKGASGNDNGGIYAIGGNNNLIVQHVTLKDNRTATTSGSGFYANGPITNVTLDYVTSTGHYPGARGIVIWNGLKSNITITNCEVFGNNCCGIELQDGTASGVTMSNNNVHDNGDNGIALLGLKGPGSNLISTNTITNNGRFGIEIKNPNGTGSTTGPGSIVVENNTVTFTASATMNDRDHAGIAVYRRDFYSGNPDGYPNIPTGVVIRNNPLISGYNHLNTSRVESEGFGIVIEGTNHTVTGNTISNCDIGIQQQGGGHPNANYVPDDIGQADQSDSKSALYFGRGNSPVACGNAISGNTYGPPANGADTRNSGPFGGAGFVVNTNSGETFCTIQAAINDAETANGHTIKATAGTYPERLNVTKSLTIRGAQFGVNPVPSGSRTSLANESVIDITGLAVTNPNVAIEIPSSTSNVTFDGFTILGSQIFHYADESVFRTWGNNIAIQNNIIDGYFGILFKGGSILAANYNRIVTNKVGVTIQPSPAGNVTFTGNSILPGTSPASDAAGIYMTGVNTGLISDNYISGFSNNNAAGGSNNTYITMTGNTFNGCKKGINLWGNTTFIDVNHNAITGCNVMGVNIKGQDISIDNNTITGNANGIEIDKNTLTTLRVDINNNDLSGNATKALNVTSLVAPEIVDATCNWYGTLNGNTIDGLVDGTADFDPWLTSSGDSDSGPGFEPTGLCDGTQLIIASAEVDQILCGETLGAILVTFSGGEAPYDIVWTGGSDDDITSPYNIPNLAAGNYTITITDANGTIATIGPVAVQYLPVKLTHGVTITYHATISAAITAAVNTDMIEVCAGTYPEYITVDKSLDIRGPNYGVPGNDISRGSGLWIGIAEAIIVPASSNPASGKVVLITADDVYFDGFTVDGDSPVNGSGIDALHGVSANFDGLTNVNVKHNIVKNVAGTGIRFEQTSNFFATSDGATYSYDNTISNNLVTNIQGSGISIRNSMYTAVKDNVVTNAVYGISAVSMRIENQGSPLNRVISGNEVQARSVGIWFNLCSGTTYEASNNTITSLADASQSQWIGIIMATCSGAQNFMSQPNLPKVTVPEYYLLNNNVINGTGMHALTVGSGIFLYHVDNFRDDLGTDHFTSITGGNISYVDRGLYLSNVGIEPPFNFSSATLGAHANISNLSISTKSGGTGIFLRDDPSWTSSDLSPLTAKRDVKLAFGSGVTVNGGDKGLRMDYVLAYPYNALPTGVSNLVFDDQTGNYIELNNYTYDIDGTAVKFDGETGATATLAENYAIEDKIVHKLDNFTLGKVQVKAGELFVTQNSGSIQRGINASTGGWIVNVNDGTFAEALDVNKSITLLGAKRGQDARTRSVATGESILDGSTLDHATQYDGMTLANGISNVMIDGFEIRNYYYNTMPSNANGNGNAIVSYCMGSNTLGASNVTVRNNYIHDLGYNGILAGSENVAGESMVIQSGWLVQKNRIEDCPYAGVEFTNVTGSQVKDNDIYAPALLFDDPGDAGVGIEIAARSRAKAATTSAIEVTGNLITGTFPTGSRAGINLLSRAYNSTSNAILDDLLVDGNTITGAINVRSAVLMVSEVRSSGLAAITNVEVTNNVLNGNANGVVLQDYLNGGSTSPSHSGIEILQNELTGCTGNGVHILASTAATGITVNSNKIISNTLGARNQGTGTLDATCNWWGSIDGDDIAPVVSGSVSYSPWLVNNTDTQPGSIGFQPSLVYCTGTLVDIASAAPIHETCGVMGSILVTFSGGSPNYTIDWGGTPVVVTNTDPYNITGLAAGNYTITVTDGNGSSDTYGPVTILYLPVTNTSGPTYYPTIQAAVDDANDGDVINVCAGLYKEEVTITNLNNITINGAGEGLTILAPYREFASTHNGINIDIANGITIKNLTIDGFANPALTAGIAHFNDGIHWGNTGGNNCIINHVTINNVDRRGISTWPETVTDNEVTYCTINNVTAVTNGYGQGIKFNGSGKVEHCHVSFATSGILGNCDVAGGTLSIQDNVIDNITGLSASPFDIGINFWCKQSNVITVKNNQITANVLDNTGIYVVRGGDGSEISYNTITLTGDGGVGIETGWENTWGFAIHHNTITMGKGGTGIVVTGSGADADPMLIHDNTLTNVGSDDLFANEYAGYTFREVGLLLSGNEFTSRTGDAYYPFNGKINNNSISGYKDGIVLVSQQFAPGYNDVQVFPDINKNTISGYEKAARYGYILESAGPVYTFYEIAPTDINYAEQDLSLNYWGSASPDFANVIDGKINYCQYYTNAAFTTLSCPPVHNITKDLYYYTIQTAINGASPDDVIKVEVASHTEGPQIIVDRDITLTGLGKTFTTVHMNGNTGSGSDSRGWFLVNSGIEFNMSELTLDGTGHLIWQGIRHKGFGSVTNCVFNEIKYEESGPSYAGTAIAAFGGLNIDVTGCDFTEIGRVGILYYGAGTTGTYSGNTYIGKGIGNWLDYGVEVGAGAVANLTGSSSSLCKGIAGTPPNTWGSAGYLITSYYSGSTGATINDCDLFNNNIGIAVGYDETDISNVEIKGDCNINNNTESGVQITGGTVNIHDNVSTITGNAIGVDIGGGSVALNNNTITINSVGVSIHDGGNLTSCAGNTITSNPNGGIMIESTAGNISSVTTNNISDNGLTAFPTYGMGLSNLKSSITVDAKNNWWGYASGPYNLAINPCGTANAVSDNVTICNWYTDAGMTLLNGCDAAPTITCPATAYGNTSDDGTGNCTTTVNLGSPTVYDNCGVVSTKAYVANVEINPVTYAFGTGTTTVTWIVTDNTGKTATCGQSVIVTDNEAPVITGCPSSFTIYTGPGRISCDQVATWTPPAATDNCTLASFTSAWNPGDTFPVGNTLVTYTATDNAVPPNTSTCSFTVTVIDNTAPVITGCPSSFTVNTGPGRTTCDQVASWTAPGASDNCTLVSFTSDWAPGATFPVGSTLVTYTATDNAVPPNTSTCSFTVTVIDNTAPIITGCPLSFTVYTGPGRISCDQVATWTPPAATDNCTLASLTSDWVPGATFPVGSTLVTYTATDNAVPPNTATCSFTVAVVDNTPPVIACPEDVSVDQHQARDPYATGYATAQDNCTPSGSIAITFDDSRAGLNQCNATGVIVRTWTAVDEYDNSSVCTQSITVTDDDDPVVTCPANITVENEDGLCSAVVNFTTSATDFGHFQGFEDPNWVSGAWQNNPSTDWNDYNSILTRVPTGTDDIDSKSGIAHAVINSTVLPLAPNDASGIFSRLGGYNGTFGNGFTTSVDVYFDLLDPAVLDNTYAWDVSSAVSTPSAGHRRDFVFHTAGYPGEILVAASNNSNSTRRNDLASINHYEVIESGWYTLEWVFRNNGSGELAVDCNLRDDAGVLLWTETRHDPSDVIGTTVGGNRYMWFTFAEVDKLAIDNTSLTRIPPIYTVVPPSGSTFNVGTTTVNLLATDACGLTETCSFTVTVNDNELPDITCPAPVAVSCASGVPAHANNYSEFVGLGGTASDNCTTVSVSWVSDVVSDQTCPNRYTITRTYKATDAHSNVNTCTQTITVNDQTAPVITTCPSDQNKEANNCSNLPNSDTYIPSLGEFDVAANDGCSGVIKAYVLSGATNTSGNTTLNGVPFSVGTTLVTWSVTDDCNNLSTCIFSVVVTAQPKYSISGVLKYHKPSAGSDIVLNNVVLQLLNNANVQVGSNETTASGGVFTFNDLCPGTYKIKVFNNPIAIGGINASDATQLTYWATSAPYLIQHARYLAGDVDATPSAPDNGYSFYINSSDAIQMQRYFVFHEPFTRTTTTGSAWSYWKVGDLIHSNGNPYDNYDPLETIPDWLVDLTVTVGSADVLNYNIYTVANGDFNLSFSPASGKSGASETLLLTYDGTYKAEAGTEVELPIRMVNTSELSAVSLILDFPGNLMEVTDVTMKSNTGRLDWAASGDELRIGWNSLAPVMFEAGENLLVIKLRTSDSFTSGESIRIALAPDLLNELADGTYSIIPDAVLSTDALESSTFGIADQPTSESLTLVNHPNPFYEYTYLTYSLPFEGHVTLEIADMLGHRVSLLVEEEQGGGKYSLKADAISLQPGVYTATLRLDSDNKHLIKTIKLVRSW